jgi:long-chain acyl-CoA synthetase
MNTRFTRIFDLLEIISARPKDQVMFTSFRNGQWCDTTISDYITQADLTSYSLIKYGIAKGEPVISITQNRAEFNFVDMGIMQVGAVHVPLYTGVGSNKLAAILFETGARIAFISNRAVLRKIKQIPECPLQLIVCFDRTEGAVYYEDFLKQGTKNPEVLKKLKAAVQPDDPASIIYLSGSNTPLKGVVLSHTNHIFSVVSYCGEHHFGGCRTNISLLPLSHSFERMVNYDFQYLGIRIYYSDGISSAMGMMKSVQPEVLIVVPLILDRIFQSAQNEILKKPGIAGKIARKLFNLACRTQATPLKSKISLKSIIFRSAFKSLRSVLGGNVKVIICGGASLQPEVLNLMWAAGIYIYEGYGLTEAGPLVSYNTPEHWKNQSVGKTMPGVEVSLATDEEVLVRSSGVMKGYYKVNTSPVDSNGWLHTGDYGSLDKLGFITLTGHKKEIFKLSSGLYTDPRPIESLFAGSGNIRRILIYGYNRSFLTALIVPDTENPALQSGISQVYKLIDKEISAHNYTCPKFEQIIKYEIIDDEWSVNNGLLNADETLNRRALYEKYHAVIEKLYS